MGVRAGRFSARAVAVSSVGGGAAGSVAGGVPAFLAAVLGGVLLPLAARAGGPRRRPRCRLFAGGPVAGASLLWPALFELASPARRCSLRAPCSPCGRLVVRVPVLSRRCAVHQRRCAGVRFLLAVRLVCTWECGGGLLLPVPPAGGVPFAARALWVGGPHAGRLHRQSGVWHEAGFVGLWSGFVLTGVSPASCAKRPDVAV